VIKAVLVLGAVVLAIFSLFEIAQTPRGQARNMPRVLWVVLVVVIPVFGPLGWLLAGRPAASGPSPGRRQSLGPDDDPDFLWGLERRRRHDEFSSWEDEFRRKSGDVDGDDPNATGPQAPL
jgi:hypothetical protein